MTTITELGLPDYRKGSAWGGSFVARARRVHICNLCGWTIPKGDHHWTWTMAPGVWGGDSWFTAHVHAVCRAVWAHHNDSRYEEELPWPPDFRSEYLAYVEWATSKTVKWKGAI